MLSSMAASLSFTVPSILYRTTFKWNPLPSFVKPTQVRVPSAYPSRGFISRIQFTARNSGSNGSGNFFPNPAEEEPPEVLEDDYVGLTKFARVETEAARARKKETEEYERDKHVFLSAIGLDEDETPVKDEEGPEIVRLDGNQDDGDFFTEVDKAVALRRKELIKEGSLKPRAAKKPQEKEIVDDLEKEEVIDLDEIRALQDKNIVELKEEEEQKEDEESEGTSSAADDDSFELDLSGMELASTQVLEPEFRTTLAELLDDAKVVPVSVDGDLDVEITGIQHDSREVNPRDLFICCTGMTTDGHLYLSEAVKRGAVAIIASKEITIDESINVKAMVMVEDGNTILAALAASFYGNPSQKLAVIGITGTNGKTTTSYLIKSMYETMGLKTGLLGTIAYYIHSDHELEAHATTPDAVYMQKLMAKMVHNGTEACVMEASSHALVQGRCDKVDFDIAVFMNLTRDHMDFHKTEEDYREAKGRLFAKMVDPERHRKVVNIDDPNAPYFIRQGNPDVPVITFSMGNKNADVYALEVQLSLFETQVLIRTSKGNLEISSGLLGRHNVYNILAAVAVGIAVGAPLDDIVKGIEEVDAIPGRCELIDEEQAFAVIVDYAHTPDALARLLDTVRECGAQRIITVVGCGGDRDRGKRPMMAKIATDKSDICILTSDNPRTEDPLDILDDMLAGVGWTMQDYLRWGDDDYYPPLPNGHRLFVYDIRSIAIRAGVAMGEEGDAVVIAGKGHETYQIVGKQEEYFDDREECREALQKVDALHAAGIDTSEFPWRVPESH
jgi:UDP-N-acetylmuramyl-tripeptide synthetase